MRIYTKDRRFEFNVVPAFALGLRGKIKYAICVGYSGSGVYTDGGAKYFVLANGKNYDGEIYKPNLHPEPFMITAVPMNW